MQEATGGTGAEVKIETMIGGGEGDTGEIVTGNKDVVRYMRWYLWQ